MRIFTFAAAIWTALALGVNAYVHFVLADPFDGNAGTLVSQGWLFRIEGAADILAAVLILAHPRRWTALIAGVVALGGLVLIVLTVYVPLDLTAIGLPYLYEPSWYQEKIIAVVAQALAIVGALVVAVGARRRSSE
jgi:hypothetical protein